MPRTVALMCHEYIRFSFLILLGIICHLLEIPLLKRRSKDDERIVKGYKSRRVDKGMLQAQAVRQRRSDRFKDLDASWF